MLITIVYGLKIIGNSRLTGGCKARIVKLVDQSKDTMRIKEGITAAIINGKDMTKDSLKKEFLKKYQFHQLQLCHKVSMLEHHILPTLEQMMDNDQTLLSFIMKQQNQTMTAEDPLIFDFKVPLEFEIILLKDSLM